MLDWFHSWGQFRGWQEELSKIGPPQHNLVFLPFLGPLAARVILIFGIQLGKVTENLNKYAKLILLTSADTKLHPYNVGSGFIFKNLKIVIPTRSTEPNIDRSSFVVINNSLFSNCKIQLPGDLSQVKPAIPPSGNKEPGPQAAIR